MGNAVTRPTPMLQRIPERDANAVTCQVDAFGDDSDELCILPEVASRLRENGWLVVDHADAGRAHPAA